MTTDSNNDKDRTTLLRRLYYDPTSGLTSVAKLYQRLKSLPDASGAGYTRAEVKSFVDRQSLQQEFKSVKVKHYFPIHWEASTPFQRIQIDLIDMGNWGSKDRFIFALIDTFSRFLFAVTIRTKAELPCKQAMKACLDDIHSINSLFDIRRVDSDGEAAFNGRPFQALIAAENAQYMTAPRDDHKALAYIDRVIRTLRTSLNRWRAATGRTDWESALPDLVDNYNSTYHDSIKTTPNQAIELTLPNQTVVAEIRNDESAPSKIVGDLTNRRNYQFALYKLRHRRKVVARRQPWNQPTIRVGTRVRIPNTDVVENAQRPNQYIKATERRWSAETYPVVDIQGGAFYVVTIDEQTGRTKTYRKYQLQVPIDKTESPPERPPPVERAAAAQRRTIDKSRRTTRRVAKEGVSENHDPAPSAPLGKEPRARRNNAVAGELRRLLEQQQ